MNRKHEMPFGAEFLGDDVVRFQLWAPAASSVALRLPGLNAQEIEMEASGDGWFQAQTNAPAGTQYQFHIGNQQLVPDPASRFQPVGVHGPSEVIDPCAYEWRDERWRGRPWEETILYEMHVGAFTPEGTFNAAENKLDDLQELGVTAIELMPLSTFPGSRNWGYDGVLPYAPAPAYGRPEDLKHFIDSAHGRNLMVFLDVVYNHFGPEGNYLPLYAPQFFTERHQTPWGQAINFDGPCSRTVRDYFIHNALYWLEEYHFDGLRFDAVHAIHDDTRPDILEELATRVHETFEPSRHIHLVLENDDNAARYLRRTDDGRPACYTAQWNDDLHHALHVLTTGEHDGYYRDYAGRPAWHLGRCLAEGFSFQGEASPYREGAARGEPSNHLPPTAFVSFLQNHDQIGNRALGERLVQLADPDLLQVATTILLLPPSPPLLFMGEEYGAQTPFFFFCDFGPELAPKVTEGRRSEFAKFAQFRSPEAQARIPDPGQKKTFLSSKLDWSRTGEASHQQWRGFYQRLLSLRQREIVPRLSQITPGQATFKALADRALEVHWVFQSGGNLTLFANFSDEEIRIPESPSGRILYMIPSTGSPNGTLPRRSAMWLVKE